MEFDRNRCLPITEDFHSLQGEGEWVGTAMHFIRLAGCSVGQPPAQLAPTQDSVLPILKTGVPSWLCRTYDGRPFWCDTDFKFREWLNFANLLDDTWENHICVTGGEPLIHLEKLERFMDEAIQRGIQVHIETSGTIMLDWQERYNGLLWVSVSPKQGYLPEMIGIADEIKLLVDDKFVLEDLPAGLRTHENVFIQPINDEMTFRKENLDLCYKILRAMPNWRLSIQTHKALGLR